MPPKRKSSSRKKESYLEAIRGSLGDRLPAGRYREGEKVWGYVYNGKTWVVAQQYVVTKYMSKRRFSPIGKNYLDENTNMPTIESLSAKVRTKILKRFMEINVPKSISDVEYKKIPTTAYPIYPYFSVGKKYLYFPSTPGIKGIVLGKFKSPQSADFLIRLLNESRVYDPKNELSFSSESKAYKFVLNRAFLGTQVYDHKLDSKGVYGSNAGFTDEFKEDLLALLSSNLKVLKGVTVSNAPDIAQDLIKSDFIREHVDIDETFKQIEGQISPLLGKPLPHLRPNIRAFLFTEPPAVLSPDSVLSKEGKYEISQTVDMAIEGNPFIGLKSFLLLSKIYKKFMLKSGYIVTGTAPMKDVATGSLVKRMKLLLRDFKSRTPLATKALKNIEELEYRILEIAKMTSSAGAVSRSEKTMRPALEDGGYNYRVMRQVFDMSGRPPSNIRVEIPKVFEEFFFRRAKSLKNVIDKKNDDEFVCLIYYPIMLIYMNFFSYVGRNSDQFQYEKFMLFVTDYFTKTLKKRGNFIIPEDPDNKFYNRVKVIIKNFV